MKERKRTPEKKWIAGGADRHESIQTGCRYKTAHDPTTVLMLCVQRRRPQAPRIGNPWRHRLDLRAIDVILSWQMAPGINNTTLFIFSFIPQIFSYIHLSRFILLEVLGQRVTYHMLLTNDLPHTHNKTLVIFFNLLEMYF